MNLLRLFGFSWYHNDMKNILQKYDRLLTLVVMSVALAGSVFVVTNIKIQETNAGARQSALAFESITTLAENVAEQRKHCMETEAENLLCMGEYYDRIVEEQGVEVAFDDIKARYAVSPFVQSSCHQLSHEIGHSAAHLYKTPSLAFTHGDTFCWSGYYHGVMETIVEDVGEEALASSISTVCDNIPGKDIYSFEYYNCVHGLGHGVMASTGGELFDALALCGNLTGVWERSSCAGGVFMENIMNENRGGSPKYLKNDDLMYPCNASPEEYKPACYAMQTSHVLYVVKGDFSKVFEACASGEEGYRGTCYQSIGRDASGSSVSDKNKTKATCLLGATGEAQENCVIGAAKDFVSYYHSDKEANAFCDILKPSLTKTCRAVVKSYYASF